MDTKKLYEGKAKIIYATEDAAKVIQYFKDDATAFNNVKKDNISGKGILNNFISEYVMLLLKNNDIPTHFIKRLDERRQLVTKLDIFPLEVIIRNQAAGSICKRLGIAEQTVFNPALLEFCYKKDEYGDPVINDEHIRVLNLANPDELEQIKELTLKINQILSKAFADINIKLIDFKIEFGKDSDGKIMLADEISPDSCRLWDMNSNEKMDKDRFRLDLGDLTKYYQEIADRFNIEVNYA